MKILDVQLEENDTSVKLVAKCKTRRVGYDYIYFKFPKKYKKYISIDASPFAAALLLPSMKQGEDLEVHGTISKKLYDGMHEIMKVVSAWDSSFKPIKIIVDNITLDKESPKQVSTFFSGGVDSFYTWLDHKNDKTDPVKSMVCVNGFDIGLNEQDLWRRTITNIKVIARKEGAELIEAESNIRTFINPYISWGMAHGGCLAAVALCLRKGIKTMYISSSHTIDQRFPWGTDIDLDPNWSTETLSFIHDAANVSRVDKVRRRVAKSPVALQYLRVCYKNESGSYNCGVCEKCIRTMLNLYVSDALDKSATFPTKVTADMLTNLHIKESDKKFHKENLDVLIERNMDLEIQHALRTCLGRAEPVVKKSKSQSIVDRIVHFDHVYTHSIVRNAFRPK